MLQFVGKLKEMFFTDFKKSPRYAATFSKSERNIFYEFRNPQNMLQVVVKLKEIFSLILENPQNMLQIEAKVEKIFFADFRKSTNYAAS